MRNDLDVPTYIRLQRDNGQFLSPGKWYGDRYARTLEEAFGQGAELYVEPDPIIMHPFAGYVIAVGAALLLGGASWLVTQLVS